MQGKMELLELELLVLKISMFSLYDFDKRVNTCSLLLSDKRVSEALRSATLCTGVFLFYIKRHLMSGNEFACSLGSSSVKIACV